MKQAGIDGLSLVSEIQQRGFAEFEHGIPAEFIDNLVDKYTDFTLNHPDPLPETMDAMLPATDAVDNIAKSLDDLDRSADTQAEWHKYRTNTDQLAKPDGYTNRSYQEAALKSARGLIIPPEDPKEFYHYTPEHYKNIAQNHEAFGWGSIPAEVGELDVAFAQIHKKAAQLALKVCALIEETHPEISRLITPESFLASPLRLLFYHPSNGVLLGAAHYDKSDLTLQLAESHRGIRIATQEGALLQPAHRDRHNAAFFPGYGLSQKIPDTPLRPAWHDIQNNPELNDGRTLPSKTAAVCARWALIFFVLGAGFKQPDKTLMHQRSSLDSR